MPEFSSWRSYWSFRESVVSRGRYVRETDADQFLEAVLATSSGRDEELEAGSYLWRAQVGYDLEPEGQENGDIADAGPQPFEQDRMKPRRQRAKEGRINPKGLPYLYLSTDRDTAMAEVRPWLGAYVSVGQFVVLRPLRLIGFPAREPSTKIYFHEPSPEVRADAVWADIDRAFSTPVSEGDDTAEYVPTQVLADLFRSVGYDGVVYSSSLGKGHNVALFDIDAADIVNCFLFELRSISFGFSEAANPYFVSKYLNQQVSAGGGSSE